jgi:hypothetical protein
VHFSAVIHGFDAKASRSNRPDTGGAERDGPRHAPRTYSGRTGDECKPEAFYQAPALWLFICFALTNNLVNDVRDRCGGVD